MSVWLAVCFPSRHIGIIIVLYSCAGGGPDLADERFFILYLRLQLSYSPDITYRRMNVSGELLYGFWGVYSKEQTRDDFL